MNYQCNVPTNSKSISLTSERNKKSHHTIHNTTANIHNDDDIDDVISNQNHHNNNDHRLVVVQDRQVPGSRISYRSKSNNIHNNNNPVWKYIILALLVTTIIVAICTIINQIHDTKTYTISTMLIVVLILLLIVILLSFVKYDHNVQQTNATILRRAAKTTEFVSSMFPAKMHQQLFDNSISDINKLISSSSHPTNTDVGTDIMTSSDEETADGCGSSYKKSNHHMSSTTNTNHNTSSYQRRRNSSISNTSKTTTTTSSTAHQLHDADGIFQRKPIAELYPETTVMLADLVGFTAWSSARDPTQVFILLESIFITFDEIAVERNVFKVETVGDCYVAVAGVPDPREDHAVVMAQFANDCLQRFGTLIQKLELKLGPGTADLGMRVGLHSGPITGGILRGHRSRFQLFGDTINTAARMESNSMKGRIQISEQTADLLITAKKENWLIKREDKIEAKGKGELQTYWLVIANKSSNGSISSSSIDNELTQNIPVSVSQLSLQHTKLVDYNTDCLAGLLRLILARRAVSHDFHEIIPLEKPTEKKSASKSIIDEVTECIQLPAFHAGIERNKPMDADTITLPPKVIQELRELLTEICLHYNCSNYFHNFEHATHVAMSVLKLVGRIVSPLELLAQQFGSVRRLNASKLYDHTFGLTSDPLTLFACAFSALIHEVDHSGVPNAVLIQENTPLANMFNGKSINEQNSFDVAWKIFMSKKYDTLRSAIFTNSKEQDHFRQIVINCVMATDMMDPQLKEARDIQWNLTFGSHSIHSSFSNMSRRTVMNREMGNRKATIVIEHLIQASHIAHTLQHWHIYRKWNEKLYRETLLPYITGRTKADPSIDWYEQQMEFFDTTVIPLANRLKDCGVFGASGHEYLNYALNNRKEWECNGKGIVTEMSERCKTEILALVMKQMMDPKETSSIMKPLHQQSVGSSGNNKAQPPHLEYAISDQFGPDSLLLTNLWSKDDSKRSILSLDDNRNCDATDDEGSV